MTWIIEAERLTRAFGARRAVDELDLRVERGEVFGLLGPNGAGKTTTIKMLTTLLAPTGGKVLVDGNDPQKNQDAVRRSFGIVFQDQSLDDELTAYENLEFHGVLYGMARDLRNSRIEEL